MNIVGEKLGARRTCVNNRRVIGFFLFFGRQRDAEEVKRSYERSTSSGVLPFYRRSFRGVLEEVDTAGS